MALFTGGAMSGLAPHDAPSSAPVGQVGGGFHALLTPKDPKRGHLPGPAPGQAPGLIGALLVALHEATQAGIPRLPLPPRGWLVGPVAQALQGREGALAAGGESRVASLCQPSGGADEMGEAWVTLVAPRLLDAVAIAAPDAWPLVDQGQKGLLGAVGRQALVGHGIGAQAPEPGQGVGAVPGRFIPVPHRCLVGQSAHGLRVGHDGGRDALENFWPRAQAEGARKDRVTASLEEAPRGARPAGACRDQGSEAGARTGLLVTWHRCFELPATSLAVALLEDAMVQGHRARRPLEDLRRGGGRQGNQGALAPGPGAGLAEMALGGTQYGWPAAAMAFLPAVGAAGGVAWACGLVEGGLRRRGLPGGLRGLGQRFLQGLHVVLKLLERALALYHRTLELRHLLRRALEVVLHGWWRAFPGKVGTGEGPQERVVPRWRGSGLAHQGSYRWGVCAVTLSGRKALKLERGWRVHAP